MKTKHYRLGAVLVVTAVLLLGAFPAAAADITESPCTESTVGVIAPGAWTFPDGNVHIREMVLLLLEDSPDARNVGVNTVVINANWHADMTGPMWGTFHFVTDEGGVWDGTWAGMATAGGSWYNAVGDGSGMYAGMKMWVDMNYGVCQVRILEH